MATDVKNENLHIDRVSCKIPPMWKNNIQIWFVQVEANFGTSQITNDLTKYNTIIGSIDADALVLVSDLILNPPQENRYEALKQRLISEFSDSQSQQLRKLLSDLTLGDKKPSTLLRQMKELGGNSVTEDFIKTIWMERLPVNSQAILSASSANLSELAKLADRIAEIREIPTVNTIVEGESTKHQIEELRREIAELKSQISVLSLKVNRHSRSRSREFNRPDYRGKRRNSGDNEYFDSSGSKFCYFHARFGERARRCREPCEYVSREKKN